MSTVETISIVLGWVGTITGLIIANLYARRAKKAEVHSKEIAIADQMIELVKKANADALDLNKKENEKLRKSVSRLEKAIRSISTCPHRAECPVNDQLQSDTIADGKHTEPRDGQPYYPRNGTHPRYDGGGEL